MAAVPLGLETPSKPGRQGEAPLDAVQAPKKTWPVVDGVQLKTANSNSNALLIIPKPYPKR